MATNAEINEKFYKATGNTWDVASLLADEKITTEKLAWMIPDGAMLEDPEGKRYKEIKDFMDAAGIDMSEKSTVEPVTNEETTEVVHDSIEVEGVTYYKEQPATPTTEPDAGKKWTLNEITDNGVSYYAWVQTTITEQPEEQNP